ncbi:hypothetical protein NECID01_1513 [Nematocida sp. AWRm77]|nr:hypothetical protein NECID01_1513 [Nematocida sp. AWRm77]
MNNGQNPNLFSSGGYGQPQLNKPEQGMYHQTYRDTSMYGMPPQGGQPYMNMMQGNQSIKTEPGTPNTSVEPYGKTYTRDEQGVSICIVSLTGKPIYKNYALEEIRAADYQVNRKGSIVATSTSSSASSFSQPSQPYLQDRSYIGNTSANTSSFGNMGLGRNMPFYPPKQEQSSAPLSSFGQNRFATPMQQGSSVFGQSTAGSSAFGDAQNKPFGTFGSTYSQMGSTPQTSSIFSGGARLGEGSSTSSGMGMGAGTSTGMGTGMGMGTGTGTGFGSMGNSLQQSTQQTQSSLQRTPLQQPSSIFGAQQSSTLQNNSSFGQMQSSSPSVFGRPFGMQSQPGTPSPLGQSGLGLGGGQAAPGTQSTGMFGQSAPQSGLGSGFGSAFGSTAPSSISPFGQSLGQTPAVPQTQTQMQPQLLSGQMQLGGSSFIKPEMSSAQSPSHSLFSSGLGQSSVQPAGSSLFPSTPSIGGFGGAQSGVGSQQSTGLNSPAFSSTGQAQPSTPFSFMNKPAEGAAPESKPGLFAGVSGLGSSLGTGSLGGGQSSGTGLGSAGGGMGLGLGGMGSTLGMGSTGLGGQLGSTQVGSEGGQSKPSIFGEYKPGFGVGIGGQSMGGMSSAGLSFAPKTDQSGFGARVGGGADTPLSSTAVLKPEKNTDPYLMSKLSFKECEEYEKRNRLEMPKLLFERSTKPKIKFKANVSFKSVVPSAPAFRLPDVDTDTEQESDKNRYYTIPPLEKLKVMKSKKIRGLVVGKKGAGFIEYKGEINLNEIDLDNLPQDVQFIDGSVRMYPTRDVDVGVGLNQPSRVILENVFAYSKSTGFRIQGKRDTSPYKEMQEQILHSATDGKKARIISYDYDIGLLEMEVDHF